MLRWNRGCVYVCMCVCVFVCVWQRYSPNGWMDFDEIFHKWSDRYLWGPFFSDFEISKRWRHGGHFCTFSLGHSHGRNFAPIFFKIGGEVESCLPLFAIENQRDRLVTSANMADRVFEKKSKWPPNFFSWNIIFKKNAFLFLTLPKKGSHCTFFFNNLRLLFLNSCCNRKACILQLQTFFFYIQMCFHCLHPYWYQRTMINWQ